MPKITLCKQIEQLSNSQDDCLTLIFALGLLLIVFVKGIYNSILEQQALLTCLATFVFTVALGANILSTSRPLGLIGVLVHLYARDAPKLRSLKRQHKRLELVEFLKKELIRNKS